MITIDLYLAIIAIMFCSGIAYTAGFFTAQKEDEEDEQ